MAVKTDKEKKYPDWWYQSKNQEEMNAVAGQIASRPAFRFEVNHEALYDYYKGEHERQGREAQIDTQAKGAALTGGYGNSYAAQAGQRAYDTQMEKLNRDVVPELREMAADQYDRETKALADRFSALQKQEKADYEAWEEENEDKIEAWEQSQREVATGGIYTTLRENAMDATTPAQLNRFERVMASAPGRTLPATQNQTQQSQASKEAADKLFTVALGSNGGAVVYYARAVDQMKAAGASSGTVSGLLKEKDWEKLRQTAIKNYESGTGPLNLAAVAYDNYTEYLRAYVSMATTVKPSANIQQIDLGEGYESTGNAAFDIFTAEYLRRVQNEDPAAKKFKETAMADYMKDQADRAEAYVREVSHWNDRANEINLMGTAGHRIPQQERSMLEWIGNTYGNTDDALAAARNTAFRYRREADNLVATNRAIYADDFAEKSVFDSRVTDETYRKVNTPGEDNHLEEQEIAVYNYIYTTEGAAKAQAYLDTLEDALNERKGQAKADSVNGNFFGQMWVKALAGFDQFGSGIGNLFNTDGVMKDPSVTQYASAAVDEDLANLGVKWYDFAEGEEKVFVPKIFGRSLAQMAGDTVQTVANMAPSIALASAATAINPTLGSWVGAVAMGSSAAGNAYQDMLNQGYSKSDAATYGVLVGVSEATLEKVLGGISPISGGGGLQKFASKFAKVDDVLGKFARSAGGKILLNSGSEAIEEGLQSVLEPFFKTIVTGEEFTVDMEEALYSALLGFVTGGMFEGVEVGLSDGPSAVVNTANKLMANANTKKKYGTSQQELVTEALELDPNNAFAKKMQGLLDNGKNLTGSQLNKLVQMNEAAIQQEASSAEAAEEAATVRNDRTAQTSSAKTDNATLKTASKKYGAQAAMMESAYQEGQDVEQYDREYKLAYDMGKEGASRELLDGGAFAYLTAQQKNTAYQSGAAAAENAGIVAEAVKSLGITGEHAGALTQSFNANQITAKAYAMGLQEAYEAGKTGIPVAEAGSHAAKLTDAQRQIAYKQGQKAGGRQVAKQQAQVRKNRSAQGADTSKGKVHFDGDRNSLNDTQKASLDAMEVLAKTLGVQIHVENFEGTKNANKNGWYDPKDGSIHINLNAGADGKGTMLFTVAHELTHFIRQWSPAKFRVLANFLVKRYGEQGVSVSDLIDAQIADAKADNRDLTREEALEEVVADSMETMLSDGSIIEMMAELKQQDHGLWAKIKEWFRDLAGKLQAVVDAYRGVQPDSTEGRMVADMQDMIGTLQALYMDALVDASENFDSEFSMQKTQEQTEDLMAYHNITPKLLWDAIGRGGLLMPSLAVTNKGMTDFGDISLVFDKGTIDPAQSSQNKLYGADAWTPTQTQLKKNARFDENRTVKVIKDMQGMLGEHAGELLGITSEQFQRAIRKADGSIYDAYAYNIGVQAAYALERGIIAEIPTLEDGTVDRSALQAKLEQELDTDDGWRQYKRWLNGISDSVITGFDRATNEDILQNMEAQPATAKTFKLSHTGELVVPAAEYGSIDEVRANKNRLSENAEADARAVAQEFLALAERIGGNTRTVVDAINAGFAQRYDIEGIKDAFRDHGVRIDQDTAKELQSLYRKAVELSTLYFEAKPHRVVGLDEIRAVIMPDDSLLEDLRSKLKEQGLNVLEYHAESKSSRLEALNSVEGVKFSGRRRGGAGATLAHKGPDAGENSNTGAQKITTTESGVKYSMRNINIDRIFIEYGDTVAEQAAIDRTVAGLVDRGKVAKIKTDDVKKNGINGKLTDWKTARQYLKGILEKFIGDSVYFTHNNQYAEAYLTRAGVDHSVGGVISAERAEIVDRFKELVKNAEYAFSSKNDAHSNSNKKVGGKIDWDCFVAVATIGEETYPVVFKIRTIDRDVRSQIYEMATKKKANGSHDPGQQNEPLGGMSAYGVVPSTSGDKVPQNTQEVKKFSDRNKAYAVGDIQRMKRELSELTAKHQAAEERYNALLNDADLVEAERRLSNMRSNGESRLAVVRSPEYKAARAERDAIKERLGVDAARDAVFDLRERERKLQAELRAAEETAKAEAGRKAELEAIEKSGLSEAEYFREQAAERFGYTQEFKYAGYLLPDGKMLDFTSAEGKKDGKRDKDHREIADIYEHTQQSAALLRFLNDGNIRIMAETPGVDLSVSFEPTKQQYAEIKRFVREYADKRQFMIDISGADGQIVGSYTYDGRISADRVVSDIQYYFQHGKLREQSSVAQFLYSQRDGDRQGVMEALEKENAKLREDVSELKELVKLQRQVTGGTKFTKTSVEAAAISLKQGANAKGSTQELAKLLNGLYEYIASAKELTWEGVKEQAQGTVDWLWEHIDRRGKPTEYAQDILKQLHGSRVRLDESQMAEAEYRFGSYEQFRKGLMGSITFAKNAEMSLDSLWAELSEMYPDVFDSEITAADMPGALMDIIHRLRSPDTAVDYARNRELMEQELLQEVYDSYWRVSTLYTPADVGARRINKLKMEHYQRMDKLKQQHRETIDRLKQEHQARLEQVRREHRVKLEEKVDQVAKRYQDARKQNVEGRKKTEQRRKIRKTIRELSKLLAHGTKERNVKEGMKDFVSTAIASAEVLFTDEYTNEDMIRNGVECECEGWESSLIDKTRALIRQRDELLAGSTAAREVEDVIVGDLTGYEERMNLVRRLDGKISENMGKLKGVFARERSRLNKATASSLLSGLAEEYWKLGTSEEAYIRGALDENVHQHLMNLSQEIGGTTVKDMSLSQLEDLHRAYTMVLTTVRNANKSFAENLKGSRQEQAQAVIWDLAEAGKKRKKQTKGQIARAKRSWNNEKPVYAFERIGSGTLKQLYENLRGGEDTWMVDMDQAREYFLKAAKDSGYNGWDLNKQIYSFESSTRLKFDLNLGQIMSVYAYARRGQQAIDHLMKGGFVFDQYTEERVTEHGIPKTYLKDDATAYNLSLQTIQEIIGKLTPEQTAFVEAMQDYLSDTMGGKGNEVSMKLYGVKLFGEKHYFPLRSSGAYMDKAKTQELQKQQGQVSIKNSGFTHNTKTNAANPVVLSGFMDVWAGHVNDMSMYHAFVLPLEDFNRVYHFSSPHTETGQSGSVNQAIINACGSAATGYIDQFIRDLNGGVVADPREGDFKRWISKFKKASVMASASVVIQQPTAIVRALAYIDPKYFGVATLSRGIGRAMGNKITHNHTKLYDELKRYAPVAAIKQMGRFDTDVGMGAVDYLTAKEFHGLKEQLRAVFKEKGYLGKRADEIAGFAAARADEITWAQIWQAVKKEVVDKQGLTVGSEEHLKAAGQRFTEVVTRTQVYDSVFSRSANMRSKGAFMSMATSFMAEPTTTANMLTDAIRKAKQGDVKFFLRVGASVAGAIIFNNILRSAVYAMRDDDEDETLVEKYLQALSGGLLDDMNPMSYLPFWRDVWSLLQGYDVERADMSVIATLIDAARGLADVLAEDTEGMTEEELEAREKKLADRGWDFVNSLASVVGLPVKNLRRDILGAVNFFETVKADGDRQTTAGSLKDKVWEDFVSSVPGVDILVDTDSRIDDLYDAIVAGDSAYVERLKSGYKTEQAYIQAVRKGLRENDARIRAAAEARINGDLENYMTTAKEIIAEGRFTQDDVVVAINGVINELTPGGSSASAPEAKGLFDANAFATAISQDDAEMAKLIQADIIRTAQRNGKTEEEAKKSFVSSVTSACKEMFGEGELSEEQAVEALTEFCDKDKTEARASVAYWDFAMEHPDVEASAGWFESYYRKVENSGIAIEDYVEYRNRKTGYTKRAEILEVIDGMGLTKAQKDALYRAEGYAESTLDEAPWHK